MCEICDKTARRERARQFLGESASAEEVVRLAQELLAVEKEADARWAEALKHADWDGGVFHHEGRIYPWPRGFVPDCPATWQSQTQPLREALERIQKLAEDPKPCRMYVLDEAKRALSVAGA